MISWISSFERVVKGTGYSLTGNKIGFSDAMNGTSEATWEVNKMLFPVKAISSIEVSVGQLTKVKETGADPTENSGCVAAPNNYSSAPATKNGDGALDEGKPAKLVVPF